MTALPTILLHHCYTYHGNSTSLKSCAKTFDTARRQLTQRYLKCKPCSNFESLVIKLRISIRISSH